MAVDMESLFLMHDAHARGAVFTRPVSQFDAYPVLRAESNPDKPVAFEAAGGRLVVDLIGSGFASVYLLSPRFQQVLRQAALRGWSTVDATVRGDFSSDLADYRLLVVTGRAGPIEDTRSERAIL